MGKPKGALQGHQGTHKAKKQKLHWAVKAGFGKSAAKHLKGLPPPQKRAAGKVGGAVGDEDDGKDGNPWIRKKKKRKQGHNAVVPYKDTDRVLLIGEGDFSFAASLAKQLSSAYNLTCTSFDSAKNVGKKYDNAAALIESITQEGGTVLHDVDGCRLNRCAELDPPYDRVVFNFPHCGLGIKDKLKNVLSNQTLLRGFLTSARSMLHSEGEIHITLKKGEPYDSWGLIRLGNDKAGKLRLKNSFDFDPSLYPGYAHRRTLGFVEGLSADANEEILKKGAKTYVFSFKKQIASGGARMPDKVRGGGKGSGRGSTPTQRKD